MEIEELREKLEEKVNKELQDFKENLVDSKPSAIIDKAYELVSKEEMTYKIMERDYTNAEIKALLKTNNILDQCYYEWLKSDGNFSEALEYTVDEKVNSILEESRRKNRNRDSR